METGNVNLTISKEIVNPIVEAKIKEALVGALGGQEQILNSVINGILTQKVGHDGKPSNYSSENKYNWIDIFVNKQIESAMKKELQTILSESTNEIKNALMRQLKTNKGAEMVASALIAGLTKTFESTWTSSLQVTIQPKK